MKLLVVGNTILAAQIADFLENEDTVYCDGAVFPKAAMEGYSVIDAEVPDGFSSNTFSWDGTAVQPIPLAIPVPRKVYRRQAIKALIIRGLYDQVLAILAGMDDGTPEGALKAKLAKAEFEQSLEFYRTWPLLLEVCALLGLNDEQIDELFIFAMTL